MSKSTYIKIGAVVTITLAAFIWGFNFLKGRGTFNNDTIFYVIYDRIDGLEVANPVLINGFKVGLVRDIHFLEDTSGRLVVELQIKKMYKVPDKSVARIFSSDLMGTKAIDLIFSDEKTLQQSGDTLIPDFEGSLQEMVSVEMLPLKNKAESLMKELEDAIEIVMYIFNEENRENITGSIKNIKATFVNLESSTSSVDSIVSQGKSKMENILENIEAISENLEKNNQTITHTLNNLSNITDSLAQANLAYAINQAAESLAELNAITKKINESQGTLGELVNNDTLYYNLEDATYNLNRLLEDLRLNPKRYVQFSAFNLGKTVYVDEDLSKDKKITKERVLYKIMIYKSSTIVATTDARFKGYKNIEEASVKGNFIYLIGREKNLNSARLYLKEVRIDFPDAQIVEIINGKYTIVN